ncbi:hypothetical protein KC345_g6152 [Hortaea werneckii]|nr:hypothetical protein KC345_g6152 [Hortaea werneckii]
MDELSGESSDLFDQWRLVQDADWCEHRNIKDLNSSYNNNCTTPRPDLTYGFPIYPPDDAPLSGFGELDCGHTFRAETLRILRQVAQLISSPGTGLSKEKNLNGLSSLDLLCYPWAIVEFKCGTVDNAGKTRCITQGEGAAKCALDMLRSLFETAYGSVPDDLPPIIFFTCVGPKIQVWLAYHRSLESNAYSKNNTNFRCIFTTSVELTWGVHACRSIVKHMHIWASRILKPQIWMCLSNVILELDPEDRAKIPTAATSSGQQVNCSNGIPKTPERAKANGVQTRAQTSIGKKSRQSKDFSDTPVRGPKSNLPQPQTAPPGVGKGPSRSMGNGNQRPRRHNKARPSSGDETDGLAEGFESLEVDEDGTEASPTAGTVSRRRQKKPPGVVDLCSEDGEDGEDGEEHHDDAESDQN